MFVLRFFLCFSLAVSIAREQKDNNVCPTFEDYKTMEINKKCWHNPDVNAKPEAIAKRYGFILQTHEIVTPDGYILHLYRLLPINGTAGMIPVLIHHGICANAANWMVNGKTSIPFYLSSLGYDVWLSNARGTEASMRHVSMSPADRDFWDFSFHEMALLDIPVTLEYIRKKRGDGRKVTFMGHSMGGTIQYVYSSMLPDHAKENVIALISVAPVVYTLNVNAAPAKIVAPFTELVNRELQQLGFYGSGVYPVLKKSVSNLCSRYPYMNFCLQVIEAMSGRADENREPEVMPLFFRRYPASFSIKSLVHFGQEISSSGRFRMFDYGESENILRYNSTIPPEYDIEKVDIPVYIIYGEADLLSSGKDNLKLYENLKTKKFIKAFSGTNGDIPFQHQDFQFSKHLIEFGRYLAGLIKDIHREDGIDLNTNKFS